MLHRRLSPANISLAARFIGNPKIPFNPLDCMNFEAQLTDQERKISHEARQFANSFLRPRVLHTHRTECQDPEVLKQYGRRGYIGANIKGEGMRGISNTAYGLLIREIERVDSGYRSRLSVQSSLIVNPLNKYATDVARERYLQKCLKGELQGAAAITEPDHGSDLSGMETYAESDGAGGYLLSGNKTWISFVNTADIMVVYARDRTNNNALQGFIVTKDMPGIEATKMEGKMALRTITSCHVRLDKVRVPAENKFKTSGLKSFLQSVNQARFGVSFGALGVAEECYQIARDYTMKRNQFGKPIAGFQLVQARLAQMATQISVAGQGVLRMGKLADEGNLPPTVISMIKKATCRKAVEVARSARELLGANGILDEMIVMRHLANMETVSRLKEAGQHDRGDLRYSELGDWARVDWDQCIQLNKMAFSLDQIEALAEMVNGPKNEEEEEYKYPKGSVLNPANIDGSKEKEEIAKPNAKIQIKVGQSKADLDKLQKEKEKKERKVEDNIWTQQEVSQHKELPDDRPQPEFEVLYQQNLATEDIYLGLSDSDPSSTHCQSLLIKVKLPHAKLREIGLDIKKQSIHVQSPDYVLNHILPYPVDREKFKAKFDSSKCVLELPVIKKTIMDEIV